MVVVLHCLGTPGQVLAMIHCLIALEVIIIGLSNRFKQHLADEDNVESKSELDRYLLESSEDPDVEDFDILMW